MNNLIVFPKVRPLDDIITLVVEKECHCLALAEPLKFRDLVLGLGEKVYENTKGGEKALVADIIKVVRDTDSKESMIRYFLMIEIIENIVVGKPSAIEDLESKLKRKRFEKISEILDAKIIIKF